METNKNKLTNLHVIGAKDDYGKPNMNLVLGGFPDALLAVGRVGTYGANKYTPNGWHEVDDGVNRYLSALLRHYLAYVKGDKVDRESYLPHLAHLAWNSLAALQLELEKIDSLEDVTV